MDLGGIKGPFPQGQEAAKGFIVQPGDSGRSRLPPPPPLALGWGEGGHILHV